MHRDAEMFRFSTDGIPERDRLEVFREEFGRNFLRLDFEFSPDVPLRMEYLFGALPGLLVAKGNHTHSGTRRSLALIAPGEEDFFFGINLTGQIKFAQRDREIACRPGEAFLASSREPTRSSRSGPSRSINLRIPRAALAGLVPNIDDATLRTIPRDRDALRLLRTYLGVLDDIHTLKAPELRRMVVSHIHDLVGLAVTRKPDKAEGEPLGLRAARLRAIKLDVLAQLSQTRLTARTLARAHGVSTRYIHILFEETGQTFSDFVREQRMNRAFELLTDSARAGMRIGDIAAEVGYAEPSTFDRAFRQWFGDTPSSIRRLGPDPDRRP